MTATSQLHLVHRLKGLEISEAVQITERAAVPKVAGRDNIAVSTVEPDFSPLEHVIEAAQAEAWAGKTRYPATIGTSQLRAVIAGNARATAADVIVSTGAVQMIVNAMRAALDAGDELIMPAPCWTGHPDGVPMAVGLPVPGRAFGVPGHLRLSFAYAEADLAVSPARTAKALTGGN